ncbi:MAG: tRNA pseudouridine(55) synthase TruB [Acidobacteria bacterium]|nr:tRNA pseudouridine(55) synthase TruB [Acidobacteriota bacterium]
MNGLLLVNKPPGITSHDLVVGLRRQTGIKKIGHAGTLDPFATGLMLMLLGRATRLSQFFLGMDKEYRLRFRLGEESNTMDVTGNILPRRLSVDVSVEQLQRVLDSFTGELEQIPPMFSAIKVGGKKLYQMARRGITVERAPRKVSVFVLQVCQIALPEVEILLRCSSGTYVRSLIHDIGQTLGCGALVTELHRTAAGPYRLAEAIDLSAPGEETNWALCLIPLEKLLPEIPRCVIEGEEIDSVRHGRDLPWKEGALNDWVRLCDPEGRLIALGRIEGSRIHPRIVLV